MKIVSPEADIYVCQVSWSTLEHSWSAPPESTFKAKGSLNDKANHGTKFTHLCFLFISALRVELIGIPAFRERNVLLEFIPSVDAQIRFFFTLSPNPPTQVLQSY